MLALKLALLDLVLLGFVSNNGVLNASREMGEFPVLNNLACFDQNQELLQQQINVSNLLYLTYKNGKLYFFFKEFFIEQEVPQLWQITDDEDEYRNSYFLFRAHPKAARYKGNEQPAFLKSYGDRIVGSILNIDSAESYAGTVSLSPQNATKVNWLRFTKENFGEMGDDDKEYENLLEEERKRTRNANAALEEEPFFMSGWRDYLKVMLIKSTMQTVEFKFYNVQEDQEESFKMSGRTFRSQSYITVKHLVYYEPDYPPFRIRRGYSEADQNAYMMWPGNIVEVDIQNVLHLHNYAFNFDKKAQRLNILWHQRIDIPLLNFFDCQKRGVRDRLEARNQLKGLVFSTESLGTKDRTLLFVDHYYVLFHVDLLLVEFNLRTFGPTGKVGQLKFQSSKNEPPEIASMKYVKHYRGSNGPEYLFAFNSNVTYELADRERWHHPIFSTALQSQAHVCPHSTATLDGVTACWGRQFYWPLSTDSLDVILKYKIRKPIAYLFLPLNIDFKEDVEYVFHYREKIVFMTYSWLLIFNETIFQVNDRKHPSEYSIDKQIIAKHRSRLPAKLFEKRRNCLWRLCGTRPEKSPTKEIQQNSDQMNQIETPEDAQNVQLCWHVVLNMIFLIVLMVLLAAILNRKKRRIPKENSKLSGHESKAPSIFPNSSKIDATHSSTAEVPKKSKLKPAKFLKPSLSNKKSSSETYSPKLRCTFSDLA